MKKVTIILGPSGSGKTTLAKKIAEGRKTLFISSITEILLSKDFIHEIEIIVCEEIFQSSIISLIDSNQIVIQRHRKGFPDKIIDCPDLVITSNYFHPEHLERFKNRPNVQIIELK